ncbi:MAG: hypothetical protein AB7O57_04230, partial [Hyphomicrobiaceae bacterium]
VPLQAILIPRGGRRQVQRARQVALYLAVTGLDVCRSHAAQAVGISHQYGMRVVSKIEDLREDPEFDIWIASLEERLVA